MGKQLPLTQACPARQATPTQGSVMQPPSTHTDPAAQAVLPQVTG
jgi:hypothetical protein